MVGQLHDVGGGKFAKGIHRSSLYVTAEQHGAAGRLDADDHGTVVELPVGVRLRGVQPRPPAPAEDAVFPGGNFDDPDGTLGEPAQQEHHRAVGVTSCFP